MVGANIVSDYSIGNTRIKIADNYCRKTASDVEKILKEIAARAQRQFVAAATAEHYEQERKNTHASAAHC